VHVIMPDETRKEFKMGRGHESDLRVNDISVSRCHALLKFDPVTNKYCIEDNLSKFGTLVLANSDIELQVD
jgi:pSer/pThr/pTyr-binding forkhead associated (FHA) protein